MRKKYIPADERPIPFINEGDTIFVSSNGVKISRGIVKEIYPAEPPYETRVDVQFYDKKNYLSKATFQFTIVEVYPNVDMAKKYFVL